MEIDMARKNIIFRIPTENDREEILGLLKKWLLPHNSLAVYLNLISEDDRICEDFERFNMEPLQNPSFCIVATNENKIIGVMLNSEINREKYPIPDIPNIKNTNFTTYLDFWRHVRKETDLYGKFPDIHKVFSMQRGCVDPKFRRQRIGKELAERELDVAKQLGYKMVMAECVSVCGAESCRENGFQSIYSLKYEDYKVNNQRVFKQSLPHDSIEVFVKKI